MDTLSDPRADAVEAGRERIDRLDAELVRLIAERAAFDTSDANMRGFSTSLQNIKNLGANDIYAWFLANSNPSASGDSPPPPDFKINLIYPCTAKHIKKYSKQGLRIVHETPDIYAKYVRPYIDFSTQAPKASTTVPSGSEASGKVRPYFSANFSSALIESLETPITSMPKSAIAGSASSKACASLVQPGVSALG